MTWPELPDSGADVLTDVEAFLARFVIYPSEAARVAHVLWIGHAWFMDEWDSTPRIAFLSPEPGSGKSRALEVTEPLVPRPYCAVALAGLNDLPNTIMSRSVVIRMQRRTGNEQIEPWRLRLHATAAGHLRERLSTWADSVRPFIAVHAVNATPAYLFR